MKRSKFDVLKIKTNNAALIWKDVHGIAPDAAAIKLDAAMLNWQSELTQPLEIWISMMRFNIICTDVLNDALYQFLSQNANRNLTRVEGIINVAVVGNQVMIPPLYGECDLAEISRYKGVIKFINQVLLNNN